MDGSCTNLPLVPRPASPPFLDSSSGPILSGLSPYVAVRCLGSGAFGEAVLAYHPDRPHYHVVLKIPRGHDAARAAAASRLLKSEASLLRTLHHPRVVPFLDYVESHDRNFIVTTFVAGGSLADKLRTQKCLSATQAARMLLDVLQALEYVHSKGVLHLDVK